MVTEGVETPEQYAFLERNGCDLVQGYLLARPVPLTELRPVLNDIDQRQRSHAFSPLTLAHGTSALTSTDPFPKNLGSHAGASVVRPIR
ncbi:putative cyclic-di-GMP phosphodiesterase AdrB [compost metagenome]